MSHDLRGSLANLRMGLQACRESPEMLGILGEAMLQEVDKLDGRLVQLGWIARCGGPQRQECNVHRVVEDWAQERGLENLKLESVCSTVDPDLLKAALDQLFQNAQTHGGGCTGVWVSRQGERLILDVRDQGEGWPEAIHEWLKDPQLWQGQIALGLAVAQRVAWAHQGELVLEPGSAALSLPV